MSGLEGAPAGLVARSRALLETAVVVLLGTTTGTWETRLALERVLASCAAPTRPYSVTLTDGNRSRWPRPRGIGDHRP